MLIEQFCQVSRRVVCGVCGGVKPCATNWTPVRPQKSAHVQDRIHRCVRACDAWPPTHADDLRRPALYIQRRAFSIISSTSIHLRPAASSASNLLQLELGIATGLVVALSSVDHAALRHGAEPRTPRAAAATPVVPRDGRAEAGWHRHGTPAPGA